MAVIITKAKTIENSALLVLGRVSDRTGTPIVQSGVAALGYKVFVLDDGTQAGLGNGTLTGSGTLAVTDVVLNTPTTNTVIWPYTDGYNVSFELDGSNFPEGDTTYQIEFHVTPATGAGAPYYLLWQVNTVNIFSE